MIEVEAQRLRRSPADSPRSKRVLIKLDDAEFRIVEGAAQLACMKLTSYAARAVLSVATNTTPPPAGAVNQFQQIGLALLQLTAQIRRAGVNLNQAVAQFHVTGEPPRSLETAVEELREGLRQVQEATDKMYDLVGRNRS